MTAVGRRVRFLVDWDWKPSPMATIAYKAGQVAYVTKPCAEKALALNKAESVEIGGPPAGIAATIARRTRKKAADGA